MIKLRLKVSAVDPPGKDDGKDFPVVTFEGTSWSYHNSWDPNANSMIRGLIVLVDTMQVRNC